MIKFGVMMRPIKALAALGEEMGNRIGPEPRLQSFDLTHFPRRTGIYPGSSPGQAFARKRSRPRFWPLGGFWGWSPRLRVPGPCGKDRPALQGPFRPILVFQGTLP